MSRGGGSGCPAQKTPLSPTGGGPVDSALSHGASEPNGRWLPSRSLRLSAYTCLAKIVNTDCNMWLNICHRYSKQNSFYSNSGSHRRDLQLHLPTTL